MLTAIIVLAGVLSYRLAFMQETTIAYDVAGWIWSDNYGWVSLNYQNSFFGDNGDSQPYKVQLDSGNSLSGYGWSEWVGWVCVGATCSGNIASVPSGGWVANYDPVSKRISGWGGVISVGDNGLIRLGGSDVPSGSLADGTGQVCYDCNNNNEEGVLNCRTCFSRVRVDQMNIPDINVTSTPGGSGSICFDCQGCATSTGASVSRIVCNNCYGGCKRYGTVVNSNNGAILGWAWNGDNTNKIGAGWLDFNAGVEIIYPWLQTQFGAVYGYNDIRQRFEGGRNATYCIFAQNVYSFSSTDCSEVYSDVPISFPTENNGVYKNALGQIDLQGLTTVYKKVGKISYNKYDQVLVIYNNGTTWKKNPMVFDNRVYVINGDLNIESGFGVANAGSGQQGNGLVVVKGNLNINSDFGYNDTSLPDDLKKLGSIAWVVQGDKNGVGGDVVVNPAVKKVVGAFLILGNSKACIEESGSTSQYPKYQQNGCGVFFSGASKNQLEVLGLLIAHAFDFRRTYSKITQGSERVIYDGRLIANPPPGLKSFAENLPVIRDFEY